MLAPGRASSLASIAGSWPHGPKAHFRCGALCACGPTKVDGLSGKTAVLTCILKPPTLTQINTSFLHAHDAFLASMEQGQMHWLAIL